MYLVPLWALFSALSSQMGPGLLNSKVWPSGLSGALLHWSSSFWYCQITRICTPSLQPRSPRRYLIVPSHQIQSPVWLLRKDCWTFAPFLKSGYASGWGGACGGREDDGDAWSGWGGGGGGREDDEDAWSGFPGRVGAGCGGLGGSCTAVFSGLLRVGGGRASFLSRSLGWDGRWWGWGGEGLEERMCGLLARIP